jgi:hypothetical protein
MSNDNTLGIYERTKNIVQGLLLFNREQCELNVKVESQTDNIILVVGANDSYFVTQMICEFKRR